MTNQDTQKLLKKGFILLRPDAFERYNKNEKYFMIKAKTLSQPEWHTLQKFPSNAARDKRLKEILLDDTYILDNNGV
jgi:hypothetical protein